MNCQIVHNVQRCIVCEHINTRGITLCGQFICETCEREIVQTEVEAPKYPLFVKRLRRIWIKNA